MEFKPKSSAEKTIFQIKQEICDEDTNNIIRVCIAVKEEVEDHDDSTIKLRNDFYEHELLTEAVKEEYSVTSSSQENSIQQDFDVRQSMSLNSPNSIVNAETTTTTKTNLKDFNLKCPSADNDKSFECFCCRQIFKTEMQLKNHLNKNCTRHFECGTCRRKFKCAAYLRTHKKTHSSDGNVIKNEASKTRSRPNLFVCNEPGCSKTFHRKDRLTVHMRIHTGDKRYQCDEIGCYKKFSEWSNLEKHLRIHVGDKRFSCNEPGCNKKFTAKCNLIEHRRIHSGVESVGKPFICEICNKSIRHNSSFRKHQKMHSGEKPYVCDYKGCDKSFLRRYRLKEHRYIHNGESPYICTDINCNRKFNNKSTFRKHALTHVKDGQ